MGMAARSNISDDDASVIDGDFLRTQVYDLPTHFASLDADIPDAGKTYLLTSPQGKVEIEAIGWSRDTLARLTIAFSVVLLVVLLMLALYFVRRWKCSPSCRRFRNKPTAFVLVILGIVAMGVCSFGVGLILVVAGLSLAAAVYDRKSCEN